MQGQIPEYFYIVITVLTALATISFVLQAGILLGFFIAFVKLRGKLESILTHVTEYALPLLASTKITVEELTPKIKTITENLTEISDTLKQESKTIKVSVDDVLEKTRTQTARVDEMVSGTLDGLSQAGAAIQHGVEVPLRHIYGVINGLRAGFETLRSRSGSPDGHSAAAAYHSVRVEEPFVKVEEPVLIREEPFVKVEEPVITKAAV